MCDLRCSPGSLPFFLLLILLLAGPAPWAAAAELSFEASAVSLSGAGAESEAVFFSVSREPAGYLSRVVTRAASASTDAVGAARFELPGDERIALPSLWLAAELETGEAAVGSPGLPVRTAELGTESLLLTVAGKPEGFLVLAERFDVLVVRPGTGSEAGAWSGTAVDGMLTDADGAEDGYLGVLLADLEPIEEGSPKAPEVLEPGDRIYAIDADRLVLWTLMIDEPIR